eukprot:1624170-Amphidinium_carterae.1
MVSAGMPTKRKLTICLLMSHSPMCLRACGVGGTTEVSCAPCSDQLQAIRFSAFVTVCACYLVLNNYLNNAENLGTEVCMQFVPPRIPIEASTRRRRLNSLQPQQYSKHLSMSQTMTTMMLLMMMIQLRARPCYANCETGSRRVICLWTDIT